jgi:hypothetical protein
MDIIRRKELRQRIEEDIEVLRDTWPDFLSESLPYTERHKHHDAATYRLRIVCRQLMVNAERSQHYEVANSFHYLSMELQVAEGSLVGAVC